MRHSDSGNKKRFEPEELRRLLRMFWLSAEDGPMSPVIDSTVKAYAYGLPLAIVHEVGPTAPVSETLAVLAVKHTVHVRVPDPEPPFLKVDLFPGPNYSPPLPDESTGIRSVHVPSMSERFSDFEMLVPCILNRVLAELNVFRPTKVTGVEGLFLFVLSYLLKSHKFTMTNVIRDAVIDADGGAVAVPCDFSSSKDSGAFYGWLQELTPGPLLYIGVGKDSDRKGEAYSAIDHWLNRNAASVHLDKEIVNDIVNNGDLVPRRVKRERRFMKMVITFDLKDIGLAARNLAALVSAHVFAGGKARTVLRLRLSGKTEGSIRRSLHFQDKAKYRRFLDDKFISLTCDNPRDVLSEWEQARDRLFGDNRDFAAEPETMITHDHGMKTETCNHEQFPLKKQVSQHRSELPKVKEGKEIHVAITPIYSLRSPKSFSDIKLRPLEDNECVRVYTPTQTEGRKVSCAEFGMAHKETGKPIDLWLLFVNCLENGGILPQSPKGSKKGRNRLKSVKHRMKEKLCAAFETDEDPFCLLTDGTGYRLKCRIEEEQHSDRLRLESEMKADIETIDGKQKLPYGLPKNTRHRDNDE